MTIKVPTGQRFALVFSDFLLLPETPIINSQHFYLVSPLSFWYNLTSGYLNNCKIRTTCWFLPLKLVLRCHVHRCTCSPVHWYRKSIQWVNKNTHSVKNKKGKTGKKTLPLEHQISLANTPTVQSCTAYFNCLTCLPKCYSLAFFLSSLLQFILHLTIEALT